MGWTEREGAGLACRRVWWLLAALALLGGCGYRPASSLVEGGPTVARVPAFSSFAADPELDVFAGSYLATRLVAMGIDNTADPSRTDLTVQGFILAARERPVALREDHTLAEVQVDVLIEVTADGRDGCTTSVGHGSASLAVPLTAVSEPERLTALQAATAEAIDLVLLESLLCVRDLAGQPE